MKHCVHVYSKHAWTDTRSITFETINHPHVKIWAQ